MSNLLWSDNSGDLDTGDGAYRTQVLTRSGYFLQLSKLDPIGWFFYAFHEGDLQGTRRTSLEWPSCGFSDRIDDLKACIERWWASIGEAGLEAVIASSPAAEPAPTRKRRPYPKRASARQPAPRS
jgi:hypothetical protein